jgi:replicative DNA helicase
MGPGLRIALPRRLEGPREQTMSDEELALLGHLIGDGCTLPRHAIQYTSKDRELAELVAALATDIFGSGVRPRVKRERTWYQTYLPAARRLTHGVRNPVARWLDELGVFGLRSYEKRVPDAVFRQPPEAIAVFLRHLWATDGCLRADPKYHVGVIRFDSSSERLSRDVQSLLLRLGMNARLREVSMGAKGRPIFRVDVWSRPDAESFLSVVASVGLRKRRQRNGLLALFERRTRHPSLDTIPKEAWRTIVMPAVAEAGMTTRELHAAMGTTSRGSTLYNTGLSRERAARVAIATESQELADLASSDVYWDEIVAIERDGEEEVYDLTVDGLHNFLAADIMVHNSIEQDSDLVMFIYRDEYYNEDSDQQGLAEVILAKHRNGPTDAIKLSFLKRYAKFADLAAA